MNNTTNMNNTNNANAVINNLDADHTFARVNLTHNRADFAVLPGDDLWRITNEGEIALILWVGNGEVGAFVANGDGICFNLPDNLPTSELVKHFADPMAALEFRPDLG